jgi:phosphate transport system protein
MDMTMSAHTRTIFDADLQDLMRMVAEMGGLAEQQIEKAFDALAQRNAELAHKVINRDAFLDAFQAKIAAIAGPFHTSKKPSGHDGASYSL